MALRNGDIESAIVLTLKTGAIDGLGHAFP